MSRMKLTTEVQQKIMTGWSQERRHGWQAAMEATKLNGSIVNLRSFFRGFIFRTVMRILWWFPSIARYRTKEGFKDKLAFNHDSCPDGFFIGGAGGGRKVAQVWVREPGASPQLSDSAFIRDPGHFSLVVLVRNQSDVDAAAIVDSLAETNLHEGLLTMDDVTFYDISGGSSQGMTSHLKAGGKVYYPCSGPELLEEGITPIQAYDVTAVQDRLPKSTKFVLLRPDFFIHSLASNVEDLSVNLQQIRDYFR